MPRVPLNRASRFALYALGAYLVALFVLIVVRFLRII